MHSSPHRKKTSHGGNGQIRRQSLTSKVALHSVSGSSAPSKENLSCCGVKQRSSKQTSATAMKMPLADQVSHEKEFRFHSPSAVAQSMGINELPVQQHKWIDHSFHRHGKEQQENKDVFKVQETSRFKKHHNQVVQKGTGFLNVSEAKTAFIQRKFKDVKCPSADADLEQFKEFHDTLGALDSNKDLFPEFLQHSESAVKKHLQAIPTPQPSHITVLKASKCKTNENRNTCRKSEKSIGGHVRMQKDIKNSPQKHNKNHASDKKQTDSVSNELLKSSVDGKATTSPLPTRIVVLKPIRGKAQNAAKAISLPSSSQSSHFADKLRQDFQQTSNRHFLQELRNQVTSVNNVELAHNRSKCLRKVPNEIKLKISESINKGISLNMPTIELKEYTGDDSSYNMSGEDSTSDAEVSTPISTHISSCSAPHSPVSSVNNKAKKCIFSATSHPSHKKYAEFQHSYYRELFPELRDQGKLVNKKELHRNRSEGIEIGREITKKVRKCPASGNYMNVSIVGLKGYAGDESSYSLSGRDPESNSEVKVPTSSPIYDLNDNCSFSPSYSSKVFVSKTAKKHCSKMTHKSQEMGKFSRGMRNLQEMMSLPDREMRLLILDSVAGQNGPGDRSVGHEVLRRLNCSLVTSSKDGCSNGHPSNLQTSSSLATSNSTCRSPKASIGYGTPGGGSHIVLKEANRPSLSKPFKENINQKGMSYQNIKTGNKRRQSFSIVVVENNPIFCECHVKSDEQMELEEKDQFEQRPMDPRPCVSGNAKQLADLITIAEKKNVKMLLKTQEDHQSEPAASAALVKDRESAVFTQNDLNLEETSPEHPQLVFHCYIREPGSSQSTEEAASPVSVLEPLLEVKLSSTKCFQTVNQDLHGFRMQLQLLKLESMETPVEGSGIITLSDEGTIAQHIGLLDDKGEFSQRLTGKENIYFSYLLDMLSVTGFHHAEGEMPFSTWHSPEFPMALDLFEKLEKKNGKQEAWQMSERKLLFDYTNSLLVEIFRSCMDAQPWVKSTKKLRARGRWCCELLAEEVWGLLVRCIKDCGEYCPVVELGSEVEWCGWPDDVDIIAKEIERMLMDELLEEVISGFLLCGERRRDHWD